MQPGELVAGRFAIVRFHAAGGMGRVFHAVDRDTGESVAVKVARHVDDHAIVRFEREIAALERLRHPCIVRYIAHGVTPDGERYLVEEWVDGVTLSAIYRDVGLSIADAVVLGLRVAGGLAAAHDVRLVHRDVKPSNLILEGGAVARVRVIDFGTARLVDAATRMTRTGVGIGTPGYMAPEQTVGREPDPRMDVFALGCVLYQGLAGCPPFTGADVAAVRTKVLLCDPAPLASRCPEAPRALVELVHRMIARSPDDRPADGAAVELALAEIAIAPAIAGVRRSRVLESPTEVADTRTADRAAELVAIVMVQDIPSEVHGTSLGVGSMLELVAPIARSMAARIDAVGDSHLCATVIGAPADAAARATRLALAIAAVIPSATVVAGAAARLEHLIDAGASALAAGVMRKVFHRDPGDPHVVIDRQLAGLVADRFDIEPEGERLVVRARDRS